MKDRDSPSPGERPLTFAVGAGYCFGWFHAAGGPVRRSTGVVLCRPMGYESMCSYGAYTQLAKALALAGFDVMRFDYHGTGDSCGDDADSHRVESWIESIVAATATLRQLAQVQATVMFGVRLGATLAVQAALRLGGVAGLVMWAPCLTGRAFTRELQAASLGRSPGEGAAARGIEALGYLYSSETLNDLQALDCRCPDAGIQPASRTLILGRDDMPAEGPLPAAYRESGMDTSYAVVPGYADMMTEPREAALPSETLRLLTKWLCAAHPAVVPSARPESSVGADLPLIPSWIHNGARESALRFGPQQLFGILTEPATTPWVQGRRSETAVVLLNVGGNYRTGPGRIYVRMARELAAQGYRVLRLDLAGLGDSHSADGFCLANLYSRDSTAEVRAVLDGLAACGCKSFFLLGICSGAFVAFQSALADERVTGQILLNCRLLEWGNPDDAGNWQSSMQSYYKSTDFYKRALLQPRLYARLLRGEVDVAGIVRRVAAVAGARLQRLFKPLAVRPGAEQDVFSKMHGLGARGTDTLMLMAAQDDGRDYVEYHFGRRGIRMHGNSRFRMVIVKDGDHTFSGIDDQRVVIAEIQTHLERLLQPKRPSESDGVCKVEAGENPGPPQLVKPRAAAALPDGIPG